MSSTTLPATSPDVVTTRTPRAVAVRRLLVVACPVLAGLFLLVGAAVLIPTILAYTAYVYWLFRGKVRADAGYH